LEGTHTIQRLLQLGFADSVPKKECAERSGEEDVRVWTGSDGLDRGEVSLEGHRSHRLANGASLLVDADASGFVGIRQGAYLEVDLILALETVARIHICTTDERDGDPFLSDSSGSSGPV
jgi:hypothetical protein